MITAKIINNTDNAVKIRVRHNGEPLDFSAVQYMIATFENSEVVASSADNEELIQFNSEGEITMRFGSLGIAAGDRRVTITAFDPLHDDGQIIIDETTHNLVLRFT